MSINTGIPANQHVPATSYPTTLPHPYTQPTSSNVPNLSLPFNPPPPYFNPPSPSNPNTSHLPSPRSEPPHPNISTYQNPVNHTSVPSGLPSCSTQTKQHNAVPTTSAPNTSSSDSSIFFRTTEGQQIANVPNDRISELPKSCNETRVAITSKTQSHVLNVTPVKSTITDDCYCFIFMNIAHLYSKTKQKVKFISDLCNLNTLFLCFCETWLKDDILDSEIQIPDFSLIRCDRTVRADGGVCVYLRHSVGFDTCLSYSNSVCEVLVLRLHQPSLILVLLYRPPSCSTVDFKDAIYQVEQFFFKESSPLPKIILLGDFNFLDIDWSCPDISCEAAAPLLSI